MRSVGRWIFLFAGLSIAGCGGNGSGLPRCGRTGADCQADGACCSYLCLGGTCECNGSGEPCNKHEGCCSGLACVSGSCAPGCRPNGRGCQVDGDCCDGACEGVDRVCEPSRCNTDSEPCTENGDCCSDLACRGGTCQSGCGTAAATCTVDSDCCSGFGCQGGQCAAVCEGESQSCDGANGPFCCSGLDCRGGTCAICSDKGFTCADTGECCSGLLCHMGACRSSVLGERCTSNVDCEPGTDLGCNGSECRPTVCRDPQLACIDGSDCCSTLCEGGACCMGDAQPCGADGDCCGGEVCMLSTSLCAAPQPNGASCGRDAECAQGRCSLGTCHPAVGDTCSAPAECLDGSTCGMEGLCYDCCNPTQSMCIGSACCGRAGQTCTGDGDCWSGTCTGTVCAQSSPGQPCVDAGDCGGGAYASCLSGACCHNSGGGCTIDADCCGSSNCLGNGTCQ